MGKNYRMLAKTLFGFEELLAQELQDLGASNVSPGVRNVAFEGDLGFMYKANLACRTAIKILKPIASFNVFKEDDLYDKVKEIPWELYMGAEGSLAVDATVFSKYFTHSQYIALKTKDAIVDRFREHSGVRPSVDLDRPDLRINIHIDRNICTLSLDSSGASLHKRGYRVETALAPISEVLAAGLILLSGFRGQSDFMDPMCGSGTLLIEAAMIAANIPANLNRDVFGFETWRDFDVDLYETIEEALMKRIREVPVKIIGMDRDARTLSKAKVNIKAANLSDFIQVEHRDFFGSEKPSDRYWHLVFNPPYDERLSLDNVAEFYSNIGNTLKRGYPGSQAWLITSNEEALKSVGLRPSKKIKVFNGKLPAKFVQYSMYQGSKKAKKQ